MSDRQFNPFAAVLAWLWPGLGHIALGERRRGGLIMFGVLFLFLGGVLIGGIDCVDRTNDYLWFLAQSICGPIALGVDWLNHSFLKPLATSDPQRYYASIALNKPNEMGTLFCALAGLMNLVVILDAMFFSPRKTAVRSQPSEISDRRRVTNHSLPTSDS